MLERGKSWATSLTPRGNLLIPTTGYRWNDDSSRWSSAISFFVNEAKTNINAISINEDNATIHYAVSNTSHLQAMLDKHPDVSLVNRMKDDGVFLHDDLVMRPEKLRTISH